MADHDLVYWDFELGEVESVLRRAPRKPLGKKEVSQALWDERLAARQEELAAAEAAGDAAVELCLILDAAEEALTGQDFITSPGLPRRTRPRRPVKAPLASTRADRLQSAKERSLRKLARRFAENGRAPQDNPQLHRRIQLADRKRTCFCRVISTVGRITPRRGTKTKAHPEI